MVNFAYHIQKTPKFLSLCYRPLSSPKYLFSKIFLLKTHITVSVLSLSLLAIFLSLPLGVVTPLRAEQNFKIFPENFLKQIYLSVTSMEIKPDAPIRLWHMAKSGVVKKVLLNSKAANVNFCDIDFLTIYIFFCSYQAVFFTTV